MVLLGRGSYSGCTGGAWYVFKGWNFENNQVLVDWLVSLKGAWVIDVLDFRKRKVLKCKWDQINRNFALEKF